MMTINYMTPDTSSSARVRIAGFATYNVYEKKLELRNSSMKNEIPF